jgi:hypothetical protein
MDRQRDHRIHADLSCEGARGAEDRRAFQPLLLLAGDRHLGGVHPGCLDHGRSHVHPAAQGYVPAPQGLVAVTEHAIRCRRGRGVIHRKVEHSLDTLPALGSLPFSF